jgi:hypothetical protein
VSCSPSIDGGILAVPGYRPPTTGTPDAVYLIRPSSGRIRRAFAQAEFAQAVFAGGWLFSADSSGAYAWRVKG